MAPATDIDSASGDGFPNRLAPLAGMVAILAALAIGSAAWLALASAPVATGGAGPGLERLRWVMFGATVSVAVLGVAGLGLMARVVAASRSRLRATEASLQASEAQLRVKELAMDAAVTGMCLTAPDGTITYANPAMVRMWGGASAEELLGRNLGEIARDAERMFAIFEEVRRHGAWSGPGMARRKDGRLVHLDTTCTAIVGADGVPLAYLGTFIDTTETREEQRRAALLARILDATTDIVGMVDADGRVCFLNEAGRRRLGVPLDESLADATAAEFHPEEDGRFVSQVAIPAAIRDGSWIGQTRFRARDGSLAPVSQIILCHRDARGRVEYLSTIARDIGAQLADAQRLRASEQQFRVLAEHSPDLILRYDPALRLTYANPAVTTATGRAPADFIGRTNAEAGFPAEFVELAQRRLRELFAEPRSRRFEFELDGPTGRRVFEARLEPELGPAGEVRAALMVSRDVTELQTAARAAIGARDRLALALEIARAGAWEWNARTGETVWSDEHYRLMGREPGSIEPSGELWLQSVHEDDRPAVRARVDEAVRRREEFEIEYRIVRSSGEVRWALDIGRPFLGADGGIDRCLGIHADITERKLAERALVESEKRFRALFDHSAEGIFLHDLEGTLVEVNEKTVELLGPLRAQLLGRPLRALVAPDSVDLWDRSMEKLLASGQAVFRTTMTGRGGSSFIAGISAALIELGGRRLVQGVLRDITAPARAERALREREARFRALATHAPVGIFECDTRGSVVFVNERFTALSGLDRTTARVGGWTAAVHPGDAADVRREWAAALATGSSFGRDFRFEVAGAGVRWVNGLAVPLLDDEGAVQGFLGTVLDVTERRDSEERERRNAAFRDALIESASEGICVCEEIATGPGIRFTIWNARMREITGYALEEINRLGWHQTVHPDPGTRARAADRMERMRRGEDLAVEEWTITRKDGATRDLLISTRLISGFSDTPRVLAVLHDITDRKLVEAELRRSEEQYRRIVQTAAEGIWTIDDAGVTTYVNPRLARMLGYAEAEMVGRPYSDFTDDEGRAAAAAALARGGGAGEFEFRYRRRDGSHVWTRVSAAPLFDARGGFLGSLAMVTDITALRAAERESERNRALLRAAIEASPAGIIVGEAPDARIVAANSAALALRGGDASRLLDVAYAEHPDRWRMMRADGAACPAEELPLARAVLRGETVRGEDFLVLQESGDVRWVLANAAPVRDGEGRIVAGVVVLPDITERKMSERRIGELNSSLERRVRERTGELEAANRELESFAYSVSHDLRAPLRGIDGWSLALLEDHGAALDAAAHEQLGRVRAETRRMGRLIDDLLRLARMSRLPLERSTVDLSALAAAVVDRHHAAEPGRSVAVEIQPGMRVRADPHLLEVALDNLVGNAFKFTAKTPGAGITIGSREHANGVHHFVRDNGAGFDMRYRDKLFQPFQRLHREAEFSGSGVGLATFQRVIRRHGGTVDAEGAVGAGATFYFTLP